MLCLSRLYGSGWIWFSSYFTGKGSSEYRSLFCWRCFIFFPIWFASCISVRSDWWCILGAAPPAVFLTGIPWWCVRRCCLSEEFTAGALPLLWWLFWFTGKLCIPAFRSAFSSAAMRAWDAETARGICAGDGWSGEIIVQTEIRNSLDLYAALRMKHSLFPCFRPSFLIFVRKKLKIRDLVRNLWAGGIKKRRCRALRAGYRISERANGKDSSQILRIRPVWDGRAVFFTQVPWTVKPFNFWHVIVCAFTRK